MTGFDAFLLGIVEGLTEFLPVSSTGHLILAEHALGVDDQKAFAVVIQGGALLACMLYYRSTIVDTLRGILSGDDESRQLALGLVVAFVPAAVVGLAIHDLIKRVLFGTWPVAIAMVVGGIAMIVNEVWRRKNGGDPGTPGPVTWKQALVIGLFQCLSLWPGMSRSMSTILGAQIAGLDTATAADFSFLLAIPTLGAATTFDLIKSRHELTAGGLGNLSVGMAVSFFVAMLAITGFLAFLKRFGMGPFGAYRIVVGTVLAVLLATGHF